jgi:hypothetical protein
MDLQQEAESAATEDEVLRLREKNGERRTETVRSIAAAFKEKDLAEAAKLIHKLTYWNRIEMMLSEKTVAIV